MHFNALRLSESVVQLIYMLFVKNYRKLYFWQKTTNFVTYFYDLLFHLPSTRGGGVLPLTEVSHVGYEPVVHLVESQSLVRGGEDGLDDSA